ncbi:MAG: hypothetical protein SFX73_06260 [Kofleriaceae bacterium]|nr:hypothetical protein [Kofleriaceae bacterium]
MIRTAVLSLALAACAQAGGQPSGDDDPNVDAPRRGDGSITDDTLQIDAPPLDMGLTPITLSQTTVDSIGAQNSVACGNADDSTAENSWYRVFRLADAGIPTGLRINSVTFGVQEASGLPAVQVKIGTYAGNLSPTPTQLDTALITPLAAETFNVPNTAPTATTSVTVPIAANVPALSQVIVEVFAPDLMGTGKYFYIGGNSAGESKPSYLRAPSGGCATPQPRSTSSLGFPTSHLVIKVSGSY